MRELGQLWRGEFSLAKTYWLYGIGGLIVLNALVGGLLIYASQASLSLLSALVLLTLALGAAAYAFIVSVAIWRSAGNQDSHLVWRGLARLVVVSGGISAAFAAAGSLGW